MLTNAESVRNGLKKAFASLRKQGFIARANYECCSGCAGYAIGESVSAMTTEAAHRIKGCVFWHQQDNEGFKRDGIHLAFGQIGTSKHGDIGLPTVEVGKAVVIELVKHGIPCEWDGTEDSRIWVSIINKIEKHGKTVRIVKRTDTVIWPESEAITSTSLIDPAAAQVELDGLSTNTKRYVADMLGNPLYAARLALANGNTIDINIALELLAVRITELRLFTTE